MKKHIVLMAALLSLAACATNKQPETTAAPAASETSTAAATSSAQAQAEALAKESVYFDFDKSNIKPEFEDTVKKQADFLMANKNDTVTLEGNCDERGSTEYNLALGERRAFSVERALKTLGVPADQMKTISYGESRPRLTCHEEKCWKENRRVDFMHSLK
jgi:peptidoglycan-associated lipoprotein